MRLVRGPGDFLQAPSASDGGSSHLRLQSGLRFQAIIEQALKNYKENLSFPPIPSLAQPGDFALKHGSALSEDFALLA
jgi:hypothetical protein